MAITMATAVFMTMVAAPCRENAIPQNSSSSADPMPVDTPANSGSRKAEHPRQR